MPLNIFSAILASFIAAMLFVPLVRSLAIQYKWVDLPDLKRKHHASATPNVGGIGIAAGVGVGMITMLILQESVSFDSLTALILVLVGALIIIGAGFYDDVKNLGFKRKFVVQIVASYLIMHAGFHFDVTSIPFLEIDPYNQLLFSFPLTLVWILGIMNAVNLLDGLDGLAGGVSLIAFSALAVMFGMQSNWIFMTISLVMIGSLAAFLVFNYKPASIFMGDSGSMFLGYVLSLCTLALGRAVHSDAIIALIIPLFVAAVPILDTTICIVRRVMAGRSPFYPDHDHIHHRLARLWDKEKAVLVLYSVASWFGINAVFISMSGLWLSLAVIALNIILVYTGIRFLGYQESPASAARVSTPGSDDSMQSGMPQVSEKGKVMESANMVAANVESANNLATEKVKKGDYARDQRLKPLETKSGRLQTQPAS